DGIRDFHVTGVQTCALPICIREQHVFSRCQQLPERRATHPISLCTHANRSTDDAEQTRLFPTRDGITLPRSKHDAANQEFRAVRSEERRVGKERSTRRVSAS